MSFQRITIDSAQMGGQPCIRGLRMPVATVVAMVADGARAGAPTPPRRVKFLIDQNLTPELAELLIAAGHDAADRTSPCHCGPTGWASAVTLDGCAPHLREAFRAAPLMREGCERSDASSANSMIVRSYL